MIKKRAGLVAGLVGIFAMLGVIFAGSAEAVGVGFYYCGLPNNPASSGPTVHRSGPNPSWYFNTTRCAGWKQTKSGTTYYSEAISGTFATLKITSMHVPDAIDQTVFFMRAEYSDKYGNLCTAFPAFGNEPMGVGDTINFGIDASTGLVETAYLIEADGEQVSIPMDDNCTSGNKWTSKIQISPNNFQPYVQWVFNDGPPNNDVFTTSHRTYKL